MKQILQDLKKGKTIVQECPAPSVTSNSLLIRSTRSLISPGTERMLLDFGKASYLEKALQQPEKVKMVLDKLRSDGFSSAYEAVKSKLDIPIPLGYSNVGIVEEVGSSIQNFQRGDRVLSNGHHAEFVTVPENLCAKIPDEVDDDSAAFTVLSSVALQGVRLSQPTLGELFVVMGAGLIGLLTTQLLKANGCRVLVIDYDPSRLKLAKNFGAEIHNLTKDKDPLKSAKVFSKGLGVDGVIIAASTKSNDPISQAAQMSRKQGRIILTGVTGLSINRDDFYEKELTFQVSCSYGPGRYDPTYEEKGHDYPIGYVRWTEQRNFEAILEMLADSHLNVKPLISDRTSIEEAPELYENLISNNTSLGLLIEYPSGNSSESSKIISIKGTDSLEYKKGVPNVGVIGAGNYASRVLLPELKKADCNLLSIATTKGLDSTLAAEKNSIQNASSDISEIIKDKNIDTVFIVTRHDSHSDLVDKSLSAGKHVFVEKPLALNISSLELLEELFHSKKVKSQSSQLMVGFNRRFSPHIIKMKELLSSSDEPKSFIMTMNAGHIPSDHWTQDIDIGGGRIIGEACHYIDLMRFLASGKITSIQARKMGNNRFMSSTEDKASITLGFEDGSFGTIFYLANGARSFPKERIEVFVGSKTLQLNNFKKLKGYGWKGFSSMNLLRQDKGQRTCIKEFLASIKSGIPLIEPEEIFEVSRASIQVASILKDQR